MSSFKDFLRGSLNIEVISEAGGHSPPEATWCFINITPKMSLNSRNNTFQCVFIPIHNSLACLIYISGGGLETQKTALDLPLSLLHIIMFFTLMV